MTDVPDDRLLEQFARNSSEEAFAALVQRHLALVHSVALRHTANPQHAEDITQAVFVILARKAGSLGRKTVLPGWLYHTARLTAANLQRAEARRVRREQEAFMQSNLEESPPDNLWRELSPQLDEAMAGLGTAERDALVLRYFQNKSIAEVGKSLGLEENTAQKRVSRALEKLRKIFTKRGMSVTTAIIAGAISANSVQAAPVALAKSVTAVALVKGATASASTLTLIKGALKIMAWTKAKTAAVVSASLLLAVGTTVVVDKGITRLNSILMQRLPDGSKLVVNRVSFGHKLFGPRGSWTSPDEMLAVEFRLSGAAAAQNPLAKTAFYRQFRCVLQGEQGIQFVEEFLSAGNLPNTFKAKAASYYGYVSTSKFPRDSRWLWIQIEQSETNKPFGPWEKVAEFKIRNPAHSANQKWIANSVPATNTVEGMQLVLRQITVETRPFTPRDIWNHVVTVPTEVWRDGVLLTNWGAEYIRLEDASGNTSPILQTHRSLDPRYVWKLDMNFEPQSNFADENVATVRLSGNTFGITTNVMGVPVTISSDGQWIDANMPTNRPDFALRYVSATTDRGEELVGGSGSWGQHRFRKGSFMVQRNGGMHMDDVKPASVTFAVVPNVRTTFHAQPQLLTEASRN